MHRLTTARNRRVRASLDLVTPIALHYAHIARQDKDDLIQVGRLGLIKAAGLYQKAFEVPFSAFARPHIRGAILHYLRDSIGLVRLPRRVQERAQRLLKQQGQTAKFHPPHLSPTDLQLVEVYRQRGGWQPLSESEIQTISSIDGWTASEIAIEERDQAIRRYWQRLPVMEQRCVQAVVLEGQSLRVTAQSLGTSAMTVQRRVKTALSILSRQCRNEGLLT